MYANIDATSTLDSGSIQSNALNDDSDQPTDANWWSLFNFTSRFHALWLTLAILLSVLSGVIVPTLAVLLGQIFDAFTSYGAKHISEPDFLAEVLRCEVGLIALGCASGILNAIYFMSWLTFGELQAKYAREKLFEALSEKDMAWYDTRKTGVETLVSRLQM